MPEYLFSNNSEGGPQKNSQSFFIIGRVKSVVLGPFSQDGTPNLDYNSPKDVGKIRYEVMYSNMNLSKANVSSQAAYPIFGFMKQLPLISELVYIIPGPSAQFNDDINIKEYYYFPPYAIFNSIQHNAFPNFDEWLAYVKEQGGGYSNGSDFLGLPVGRTFQERKDVRTLRPFEGDTIIESRFGQSIRFGSSVVGAKTLNTWSKSGTNGNPILIIRNGQGKQKTNDYFDQLVEDINEDPASIWLTTDQAIEFKDLYEFPLSSYGITKVEKVYDVVYRPYYRSNETLSASESDRTVIPT